MTTDTRQIVDNFALCHRFAVLGDVKPDNGLLPRRYTRVQVPYMKQNRKVDFSVGYGDTNKSFEIPESCRIIGSVFLKITLPAASSNYKRVPGLHIVKNFTLRCSGNLVFTVDYQTLLSEHLQSLSDEDAREYCAAYLGDVGAESSAARDVYLPVPLFNSSIWFRGGRGNGVMPFQSFRQRRIELSYDMFSAKQPAADGATDCPAMTGGEMVIKECILPKSQEKRYLSARANYSTVGRKFTRIQDWEVAEANATQNVVVSNLSGCVTQLIVEAIPWDADIEKCDIRAPITPSKVRLIADSVQIVDQPEKSEIRLIEYQHGFKRNEFYSGQTYRLCFSSHGAEDDTSFVGALNFSSYSQVLLKIEWDQKCYYKVHAVQLVKNNITLDGDLTQRLDA